MIWPISKKTLDEMLNKIKDYQAQQVIRLIKSEKFTKHLGLEAETG